MKTQVFWVLGDDFDLFVENFILILSGLLLFLSGTMHTPDFNHFYDSILLNLNQLSIG